MITNFTKHVVSLANRARQAITARFLLRQTGDYLLLETGDRIILEFAALKGNLARNNVSLSNQARSMMYGR